MSLDRHANIKCTAVQSSLAELHRPYPSSSARLGDAGYMP